MWLGIEVSRTPKGKPEQLAIVLTYQCKLILFIFLYISLYQIRTDTNYVKGSCTTIILKDLNNIILYY